MLISQRLSIVNCYALTRFFAFHFCCSNFILLVVSWLFLEVSDSGIKQYEIVLHTYKDFICDRGNQAYKAGNLLQAEDFYTKGIKSVSATEIPASCLEPLVLCYSNRAATRMSLRRMREAISDCSSAAALDSNFLKVKLRAAK